MNPPVINYENLSLYTGKVHIAADGAEVTCEVLVDRGDLIVTGMNLQPYATNPSSGKTLRITPTTIDTDVLEVSMTGNQNSAINTIGSKIDLFAFNEFFKRSQLDLPIFTVKNGTKVRFNLSFTQPKSDVTTVAKTFTNGVDITVVILGYTV